ncbi:HAD-IIIA family hydrolase [Deltaproteobacteria bacterium OttesenSCG-928-K17]|nr:HAD-IIIA family hydrolase [Deltaproteobacteria bacterium OttesenSCG-928-K17]
MNRRPAVFLDRDGVITAEVFYEKWGEWEAPLKAEDLAFLPGVFEALSALKNSGRPCFLISNQAAHAKGKVPLKDILKVADRVREALNHQGFVFTDEYYSFSHPRGTVPGFSGPSLERKPGLYFPLLAEARHDLDLKKSWFVGDRETDILCGRAAGMRTVLIANKNSPAFVENAEADYTVDNLSQAVDIILKDT